LGEESIERDTVIFQFKTTQDSNFCNWMLQLGRNNTLPLDTAASEEEITTVSEDGDDIFEPDNNIENNLEEFIHVNVWLVELKRADL
jgi:hypothetical protein